ncbi:uncharacterized protein TRIVIDRAFT_228635 [Trichoderma virens Gv29-8]|uniref:Uncharacterized protein n=1 Tax=Hypocrea virens (strain Gv29-8 / FGSC 10586) TaxID=413071 RepID=G9ND40_HYPVG|nr:uncharacterized protein TRIVIDRAFT_228635 [Trichoderma virens Gv29-8]EHK15609.1 hypothetical protein TRIVIDRAFT_228635 [Trichoderma virens Gv29-8]UKZ51554.1 hypothetical protein TrVGV298_005314 [Trichoderma virens]
MKRFARSLHELSNSQFGDNATILQGDVFHHDSSDLPKPPRSVVRIIPYPRNRHLVHRPDLMNKLDTLLLQTSHSYNSAALWGPEGSGEDLLTTVREEIAAQPDWMLIIDGADNLGLYGVGEASKQNLSQYIPQTSTGTVLWTSRDAHIAGTLVDVTRAIKVPQISWDEEKEFLKRIWGMKTNEGEEEKEGEGEEEEVETAALLKELHGLPLAITQVGEYMKRTPTPPSEYLSLLAQDKERWDTLNKSDKNWRPDVPGWRLSISKGKDSKEKGSKEKDPTENQTSYKSPIRRWVGLSQNLISNNIEQDRPEVPVDPPKMAEESREVKPLRRVHQASLISGYVPAERGPASSRVSSVFGHQDGDHNIASLKESEEIHSDGDTRSVLSEGDDIRLQTSDATATEAMAGKVLIRAFLADHAQFEEFCKKALVNMNRRLFVENMSLLLSSFHMQLAEEANSEAEKAVAGLLRSKRSRRGISEQLATHIDMEHEEVRYFGKRDLGIPPSEMQDVENWISQAIKPSAGDDLELAIDQNQDNDLKGSDEPRNFPYIPELKKFLSESKAFRSLQIQLALICLSADLGYMLQSISKANIWLSQEQDASISNRFKASVESATKVRWNWWPLSPRKRMLTPGESRLFWQCTCGTEQWDEISPEQRELVERILELLDDTPPLPSRCGVRGAKATLLSSVKGILRYTGEKIALPSRAATRYTPQGDSSSTPPENQQYRLRRAVTLPQPQGMTISQQIQEKTPESASNQQWWILFGVKGARRTLEPTQIHVTSRTTDGDIFQELKRSYKIYRGRLRLWFSVWRLEYCDVVKFSRLAPDRIVREHRDLPSDKDYHYDPRAGERDARNPPISPHHFQTLFYACCSPCTWPFPHDCIPVLTNTYNLARIPKRTREFESDPNSPIWGFETVFAVSFGYVLAYHCLMVAGPFIFWGLWLKFHPDDLQNASVPITVVIGALSLFWSGAGILTSRERE